MDALTLRTGHKNFNYQAPFTFSTSQQQEGLVTRWALLLKKMVLFCSLSLKSRNLTFIFILLFDEVIE